VFHPGQRLLLALGLTLLLAACGSSATTSGSAGEAGAKATIARAFRALASGDGATVCSLTTAAGRRTLAASLPHASCQKVVALASRRLTKAQRAALASVVIHHVRVNGDQATVTGSDVSARRGSLKGFIDSHSEPTRLSKQADGSWKISG
jgi:hypothetical protein